MQEEIVMLQKLYGVAAEFIVEYIFQIVGIACFGESSIEIGSRYWVPTKKYFHTLYKVNLAVHQALQEARITIPYPQRDVRLVGDAVALSVKTETREGKIVGTGM